MRCRAFFACLIVALVAPIVAGAVEPDEVLADPVLEARARDLSKELRCLVCQNQSIDDSNAGLAKDLRVLVRQRLVAGDSDDEVLDYVVARYGDFVLLRPPIKPVTYLLWFGPAVILALAIFGLYRMFRGRTSTATGAQPLSEEEMRRVRELMDDEENR